MLRRTRSLDSGQGRGTSPSPWPLRGTREQLKNERDRVINRIIPGGLRGGDAGVPVAVEIRLAGREPRLIPPIPLANRVVGKPEAWRDADRARTGGSCVRRCGRPALVLARRSPASRDCPCRESEVGSLGLADVVLGRCAVSPSAGSKARVGSEWSTRTPEVRTSSPGRVWQHEGGTLPVSSMRNPAWYRSRPALRCSRHRMAPPAPEPRPAHKWSAVATDLRWHRPRCLQRVGHAALVLRRVSQVCRSMPAPADRARSVESTTTGPRRDKAPPAAPSIVSSTAERGRTNSPPCSANASARPWNCSSAHTAPLSIGSQHRQKTPARPLP